ncbi:MAG: hypothetical protein HRF43_16905, partial [Phycisphaerae bacterium]
MSRTTPLPSERMETVGPVEPPHGGRRFPARTEIVLAALLFSTGGAAIKLS